MSRVLAIGDQHLPFTHPLYLDFCVDIAAKHKVDTVVMIGDLIDNHALSFYENHQAAHSAEDEAQLVMNDLEPWKKVFPKVSVCIGNHDERHFRSARRAGVPDRYVRDYSDVWETPEWLWLPRFEIDGVIYSHGTGNSGKTPAFNRALANRASTVIGHTHASCGIKFHSNSDSVIFGVDTGCGIDIDQYAFEYGRDMANRPILGCAVIEDGDVPYSYRMPCGPKESYHKTRAGSRRRKKLPRRTW